MRTQCTQVSARHVCGWNILGLTAVCLLSGVPARANPIAILNSNFGADSVPNNPGFTNSVTDWTGSGVISTAPGSGLAGLIATYPGQPANQNSAFSNSGYTSQELSTNLVGNVSYTLTAEVGWRSDIAASVGSFPTVTIDLGTGATPGTDLLTPASTSAISPAAGEWSLYTATFVTSGATPNLGQPLRIDLTSSTVQAEFGQVTLTATPEPSSWLLGCLAASGLALAARRGRNKA
jgi:hypothetical protein